MTTTKDVTAAANLLLTVAREEFDEPKGRPESYRFSLTETAVEIMRAHPAPISWRVIPLNKDTAA